MKNQTLLPVNIQSAANVGMNGRNTGLWVMNEMRLDMSMPDHRKLLKKHEKIFAGVLSPEGEIIDYANEDNRKPDENPNA